MGWALLGLTLLLCAPRVSAQEADAEAMIDEGIALREQGRDAEALERFVEAHAQTPTARSMAQIGLAEQALGRFVEAEEHLRDAMGEGGEWIERNRDALARALSTIGAQLGSVELVGGPEGAVVQVDGREVGTLPLAGAVRVPGGTVRIEVRADEHHPFHRTMEVRPGGLVRVEVVAQPREPEAPVQQALAEPRRVAVASPRRPREQDAPVFATVSLVLGAALAAGGIVTALWWIDRAQTATSCEGMPRCVNGDALRTERDVAAGTTVGLAVAGTALLITGLVLLSGTSADSEEVAVRCGPLGCGGSF